MLPAIGIDFVAFFVDFFRADFATFLAGLAAVFAVRAILGTPWVRDMQGFQAIKYRKGLLNRFNQIDYQLLSSPLDISSS